MTRFSKRMVFWRLLYVVDENTLAVLESRYPLDRRRRG